MVSFLRNGGINIPKRIHIQSSLKTINRITHFPTLKNVQSLKWRTFSNSSSNPNEIVSKSESELKKNNFNHPQISPQIYRLKRPKKAVVQDTREMDAVPETTMYQTTTTDTASRKPKSSTSSFTSHLSSATALYRKNRNYILPHERESRDIMDEELLSSSVVGEGEETIRKDEMKHDFDNVFQRKEGSFTRKAFEGGSIVVRISIMNDTIAFDNYFMYRITFDIDIDIDVVTKIKFLCIYLFFSLYCNMCLLDLHNKNKTIAKTKTHMSATAKHRRSRKKQQAINTPNTKIPNPSLFFISEFDDEFLSNQSSFLEEEVKSIAIDTNESQDDDNVPIEKTLFERFCSALGIKR